MGSGNVRRRPLERGTSGEPRATRRGPARKYRCGLGDSVHRRVDTLSSLLAKPTCLVRTLGMEAVWIAEFSSLIEPVAGEVP